MNSKTEKFTQPASQHFDLHGADFSFGS